MPETRANKNKHFRIRAGLPKFVRLAAVLGLCITAIVVIAGFFRERSKTAFRLKSEHTQLSTDVTARVSNYERLESDGDKPKFYIKADIATTFADFHQELSNLYLQTYDDNGQSADIMTADKALYVPGENKTFTAYMNGNVNILTRDALKVKTENLTYTKASDLAEADEPVEFEHELVRGKSTGAVLKIAEKHLDLPHDVEINTFESHELAKANVSDATIKADQASYDQQARKIEFRNNVSATIQSKNKKTGAPQLTNVNAARAIASLAATASKDPKLSTVELFDNVHVVSTENGGLASVMDSGYALYDKENAHIALKTGVHIVNSDEKKPLDLRAGEADYEQTVGKIILLGSVEITQGSEYIKGDKVTANLFADKKLKNAEVAGNAFLRQSAAEKTTEVTANTLTADFAEGQLLRTAHAIGESVVVLIPKDEGSYSRVTTNAAAGIALNLKGDGLVERMQTDGRTLITMDAPSSGENPVKKTLAADTVNTVFNENGKDIRKAEAVGNAELKILPVKASPRNYATTINASRFDCDFYPAGNSPRECTGNQKTKTVRVPTQPTEKRGIQTVTSDQIAAGFDQQSRDISTLQATGNAKFNELDRTAIANQLSYTSADETVRLRGGEPTAWDSKARGRAREIDWDTRSQKSFMRGEVSTTYYSRKHMNDAAPFASSDKPVYVTAQSAEFDHANESALYIGNARGWQENNFVRGDTIFVDQRDGILKADGSVQSAIYSAKQKEKGRESIVPVFSTAARMTYNKGTRIVKYEGSVDMRQGTDRVQARAADVYLGEDNTLSKAVAEGDVKLTQPGRKGSGDWVQYIAADETAVLRGNPARVEDSENGSSSGGELTFFMREKRVVTEPPAKANNAGRIRSVYKIKTP